VTYGDYILSTGSAVERWEEVFGRYLYDSRFQGKSPILDIGPGRCWFTRQSPKDIVALDIEQALVDRYSEAGLNIVQGSVYEIPFEDATFKGVFCCWLFEHLHEPEVALREIGRVLATGGYACIIVPSARSLLDGFYDDYTHVRPFTELSLSQLARDAGFATPRVQNLFWTKGSERLARRVEPSLIYSYLRFFDRFGRRLRLTNRNNLVLEVRK
jgi:SAM-dependent methyltransferase